MGIYKRIKYLNIVKSFYYSIKNCKRIKIIISKKTIFKVANGSIKINGKLNVGKTWNGYSVNRTLFLTKKNSSVIVNGNFRIFSGCTIGVEENAKL